MFGNRKLIFFTVIAVLVMATFFMVYSPVHAEGEPPPADDPQTVEIVGEEPDAASEEAPQAETTAEEAPPAEQEIQDPPEVADTTPEEGANVPDEPSTGVEATSEGTTGDVLNPAPENNTSPQAQDLPIIIERPLPAEPVIFFPEKTLLLANDPTQVPVSLLVDENGVELTLASEEAGAVSLIPDPYFFVGSTKYSFTFADCDPGPGVNSCTNPIQAAFDYMAFLGLNPTGGAVYVEPGTYNENLAITNTMWGTKPVPSSLSLIGAGTVEKSIGSSVDHILNGTITVMGMKSFTLQAFTINNNADSIAAYFGDNTGVMTINDVVFNNEGTFPALVINQNGAINLNMVDASDNGGQGAQINNRCNWVLEEGELICIPLPAAAVTVKNSSFNRNSGTGLDIKSNGAVTVVGITVDDNGFGASIVSKGLTINQSSFSGNGSYGLSVDVNSTGGNVSIQNSQINNNADSGAIITPYGNVDIKNVRVADNGRFGLFIETCDFDGSKCNNPYTGNVAISQTAVVGNGADPGLTSWLPALYIFAKGTINLTNVSSVFNVGNSTEPGFYVEGAIIQNPIGGSWAVNIIGSNFNNNSGDGLDVYSRGIITLKDVETSNNGMDGSYLANWFTGTSSGINILNSVGTINKFNNNTNNGLRIFSNGAVVVNGAQANENGGYGVSVDNSSGNAAVTIDGVSGTTASNNGLDGVHVISRGLITVKNMTIQGNAGDGMYLDNTLGSAGINILSTLSRWVNNVQNNGGNGLTILSNGPVVINKTRASDNQHYGASIGSVDNPAGDVTITDSYFDNNAAVDVSGTNPEGEYGLSILSKGNIKLTNNTAYDNGHNDTDNDDNDVIGHGVYLNNLAADPKTPKTVTITKGNFNNNFGEGMIVKSEGAVTLKTGDSSNNLYCGVTIYNDQATGNQAVTIGSWNIYGNGLSGLIVYSKGNIGVTETQVSDNGQITTTPGVILDNSAGSGNVTVAGTPSWVRYFGNNGGPGMTINSNGNVSVSNLDINDNKSNGLTVDTQGTILLDNVNVINNWGYGVKLDNIDSTKLATVIVRSAGGKSINDNGDYGLWVLSNGAITVTNIEVCRNGDFGVWLDNSSGTTGGVTINNSIYRPYYENEGFGLQIDSRGAVSVNLVDSYHSLGFNGDIDNDNPLGTATPAVTITNSWFNNSQTGSGMTINSKGAVTLTNISAYDNQGGHGLYVNNGAAGTKGNVTLTGPASDSVSNFGRNATFGLQIISNGAVAIKWINVYENQSFGAKIDNDEAPTLMAVSITGANFDNNARSVTGDGLNVASRGNITLLEVFASGNGWGDSGVTGNGMILDNCALAGGTLCTGTGAITLTNTGAWGNNGDGISAVSYGAIKLLDIGSGWNAGNGGTFDNVFSINGSSGPVASKAGITISLPSNYSMSWGSFENNGGYGLRMTSNGVISVANVNVISNGSSDYGAYFNNSTAASPMAITVTKSFFNNNNAASGVRIFSNGAISFTNNQVNYNQGDFNPNTGAALLVNNTSTTPQNVTISASGFGNNQGGNGLLVYTKGNVVVSNTNAIGNAGQGASIHAEDGIGSVTVNGTQNTFTANGSNGLQIQARGAISVTNILAEINGGTGLSANNCLWNGVDGCNNTLTSKITVTNANLYQNAKTGIYVDATGPIDLTNVTSLRNGVGSKAHGAELWTVDKDITIKNSCFQGNEGYGIFASTGSASTTNTLKLIGTTFMGNNTTKDPALSNLLNMKGYISIQ